MWGRISVVALLALALAGCGGTDQKSTAPADFVRHANAVQAGSFDGNPSAYTGIEHLVPVGPCAIGIGLYNTGNGKAAADWTGNADCTSFALPATADRPGLAATSAVALADGSVVGANTVLQRLNPDGSVTPLADLHLRAPDPSRTPAISAGPTRSCGPATGW